MTQEELTTLITDYLCGNTSPEENRQLIRLLSKDKEAEKLFKELSAAKALAGESHFRENELSRLSALHQRIEAPRRKLRRIRVYYAAAAVAFLVILSGCLYFYRDSVKLHTQYAQMDKLIEVESPLDSRTIITLPDGSTVTLNSGTKISYRRDFGVKDRNVRLSGEALFDVKHDSEKPFSVNVKGLDINVLGTRFDVNAYDDDSVFTVSLIRGKVKLVQANGSALYLHPNEKAYLNRETAMLYKKRCAAAEDALWTDGDIHFYGADFKDVAKMLEHRFGVKIIIQSNKLKSQDFTGTFSKNETLPQILKEINVDNIYQWKFSNNTVTIYDK